MMSYIIRRALNGNSEGGITEPVSVLLQGSDVWELNKRKHTAHSGGRNYIFERSGRMHKETDDVRQR